MSVENNSTPSPDRFTVKELLIEVRTDVKELHACVKQLSALQPETTRQVRDHETRLRGLERWRYSVPAAILTAVGAVVASIFGHRG